MDIDDKMDVEPTKEVPKDQQGKPPSTGTIQIKPLAQWTELKDVVKKPNTGVLDLCSTCAMEGHECILSQGWFACTYCV